MANLIQKSLEENTYIVTCKDICGVEQPILDSETGEVAIYTKEELETKNHKGILFVNSLMNGLTLYAEFNNV